jgi:hypothetical protein
MARWLSESASGRREEFRYDNTNVLLELQAAAWLWIVNVQILFSFDRFDR